MKNALKQLLDRLGKLFEGHAPQAGYSLPAKLGMFGRAGAIANEVSKTLGIPPD
jgi:hypothetical protein